MKSFDAAASSARELLSLRHFRVLALLLIALALVCTRVPLLNYLGFEYAALLAVVGGYCAGLLMLAMMRIAEPSVRLYGRGVVGALALLIGPLAVISLNAFLVRNCSFADGLSFFLLGPAPAVLFTSALAFFTGSVFRRWRKTWFTLIFLAILSHILIVTLISPRIFAFNPILGFFPGITYDESLAIQPDLLRYRIVTLIACMTIVGTALAIRGGLRSAVRVAFLSAGWLVLVGAFVWSDDLEFSSSESRIQGALDGEYSTEHFIIRYQRGSVTPAQIERLARRHEFYFDAIARELRVLPALKIRSYLYASAEQKGRLIGAAATNIAKPWLWQLHINVGDADRVLKHEMVHVMAAEFGFPLLRISLNSGLIEGLATAVERTEYNETLHRLAAQVYATGLRPDVEGLFSLTGFMKGYGATSYVVAGSFCRYLIDQYGMRRFKWLYRTGSFESFYNKPLEVLVAEWRRFIAQPEPTAQERTRAAFLFRRPSIFGKECARVIAGINEDARRALREKRFDEAVELSRRSLDLSRSPEAILLHSSALLNAGRYAEALEFGAGVLEDSTIAHTLFPMYLSMGDASWRVGDLAGAERWYEALYAVHLSPSYDEASGIRLTALYDRYARDLQPIVLGDIPDSLRISWLEERLVSGKFPALVPYLLGRELITKERWRDARSVLQVMRPLNAGILEFLRLRRLGLVHRELGEYQRAKTYYWESLNYTSKEFHRLETQELLRWCDWLERESSER